jgi:hypothetical protein
MRIAQWFDRCVCVRGRSTGKACASVLLQTTMPRFHRRCHPPVSVLRYESVPHVNLRFAGKCQIIAAAFFYESDTSRD